MTSIIEGRRLAALLQIPEAELQELAQERRLPFGFSALGGLYVRCGDLALWEAAAKNFRRSNAAI